MEVTVESVIGGTTVVKGTSDPVSGLTDASLVITCDGFIEKRIYMTKNGLHLPLIQPNPGDLSHTKYVLDNFISLNAALATGDVIYIETISI